MSAPLPSRLSKTRFCSGVQCTRLLWWLVHDRDAPELVPGPGLQAIFDQGHRVGAAARERFPGGVLVDADHRDFAARLDQTRKALLGGAPAIFEASFAADGVFVAVDVLERQGRRWNLVEVKSTSQVKEPHHIDVAVQLHALRSSGIDVQRADLMHLNTACTFPDLSNLFVRSDVTREAEALLPGIPGEIRKLGAAIAGPLPEVKPGPQCTDPYDCPFQSRCWPALPAHHVSTLYRIGKRAQAFVDDGYATIHDLPGGVRLTGPAARQFRSVRAGAPLFEPGLAGALAAIQSPAAFLDFETVNPAIPVWNGCHPFEAVPVQMSCHVRSGGGELVHHAFLAEGAGDPRPAIADAVVAACKDARTVVAYNAPFERRQLEHLAAHVPARREALLDVAGRLVDLLPIVREHVYDPAFGGSFSLKSVAPALAPGLGYGDLEIGEGSQAQFALEDLLLRGEGIPDEDRTRRRRQLLDYCERDTLATVRVYEKLQQVVG